MSLSHVPLERRVAYNVGILSLRFLQRGLLSLLRSGQLKILPVVLQPICKFLYLFFPRDIQDSLRIVVQAFPQEIGQSRLDFCPLQNRFGNDDDGRRLRTRQSAPDVRSLEIGS
jgi:hypothetical protein